MVVRSSDLIEAVGSPDPEGEARAWGEVLREMPRLRRYAVRACRGFALLDPEEALQDLCLDLVASRHLYDPSRGPWIVWAKTRSRLAGLRQQRLRDRHQPLGRRSIGSRTDRDEDGSPIDLDPGLGVGRYGSPARSEAAVDACLLYRRSSAAEREVAVCLLLGLDAEKLTGIGRQDRAAIVAELGQERVGRAGSHHVESPKTGLRLVRGRRGWGWGTSREAIGFSSARAAEGVVRAFDPAGTRRLRVVRAEAS